MQPKRKPNEPRAPAPEETVSLTIKNVPRRLADLLKAQAARNHRSLQGELMAALEYAAVGGARARLSPKEVLERARARGFVGESSVPFIRALRDGR